MRKLKPARTPGQLKTPGKTPAVNRVINEALRVLSRLGIPLQGVSDRNRALMAMCFLAVADVRQSSDWSQAKAHDGKRVLKSREIIQYLNQHFGEKISSGSYDDIRRKHLVLPVAAGIILRSANDPNAPRNSPTRGYALETSYASVIQTFNSSAWEVAVENLLLTRETLIDQLAKARVLDLVPITLPSGLHLAFSPGAHNRLHKSVIEEFLPRYGCGAEVLYVGDVSDKYLYLDDKQLKALKFFEISHGELPDIVAYSSAKNWLYLIEAVHSFGPISPTRLRELQTLTRECSAEIIYVTAFEDRTTFRKFAPQIAWETEVWIAQDPDHLIHFDGQRFLGPYPRRTK